MLPESVAEEVEHWLSLRDVSIGPGERGTHTIGGSLSTADGARLAQRLTQIAGWLADLGDTRHRSVLRSIALGMLADPGTIDNLYARLCAVRAGHDPLDPASDPLATPPSGHPLPATVLYVHHEPNHTTTTASGSTGSTGTAPADEPPTTATPGWWSMDGHGATTPAEAADLVGHSHVMLKPVIDLAAPIVCPGYVASPRLKEQLALMNGGLCTFPYCDQPAWTGDYDHEQPYPRGPTSTTNGHRPCRRHHRAKTFAGWHVETITTGVWLWTSPTGQHHLVTAGVTTPLTP